MIHTVQGVHIYTKSLRNTVHIESKGLQKIDEVHLLAGEGVVEFGTRMVALRPRATF